MVQSTWDQCHSIQKMSFYKTDEFDFQKLKIGSLAAINVKSS